MLARLDVIPGVAESRVDWSGRRFLLTLEAGSQESAVATAALATLGDDTTLLSDEEERTAFNAYRGGEAWMRAGETLRLSHHEAGVLAERYGTEIGAELDLNEQQTGKLVKLFESELTRAFERVHRGGEGSSLMAQIAQAADRIVESSRAFLDAKQVVGLEEILEQFSSPPQD